MLLIHIDKPCCYHMSEIIPDISTIYQMEQEFFPYLTVEFRPNDGKEPGIILQTALGDFRKAIKFDSPENVKILRKFIWHHLKLNHNITDITDEGCLSDFRKLGKQNVIQGWQAAKQAKCSNCFADPISMPEIDQLKGIKHQVYNLDPRNMMDRDICTQLKNIDCDHTFATASDNNRICKLETAYYCKNRYADKQKKMVNKKPNKKHNKKHNKKPNNPNIFILSMFLLLVYVGLYKRN